MSTTKELKRKGKPLGIKPSKTKQPNNVREEAVRVELSLKQKIIINWMNKATVNNLTAGSKAYKEKQLEYVLDLSGKFGKQFPQDVYDCAVAKKDIVSLLRSSDETEKKS